MTDEYAKPVHGSRPRRGTLYGDIEPATIPCNGLADAMDACIDAGRKRHPDPKPTYRKLPRGYARLPNGAAVRISSVTAVVGKEEARPTYIGGIRAIVDTIVPYTEVHVAGMVVLDDAPRGTVELAIWGPKR